MCGLVGVFGDIDKKSVDVFHEMLIVDVIRGPHSTGVGVIPSDHEKNPTKVYKKVGSPYNLLFTDAYQKEVVSGVPWSMQGLIGHNRFATIGEVNDANAHPYQTDSITMAHNGTINNTSKFDEGIKYVTDSATLCAAIARNGLPWVWERLEYQAAAALSFWDNDEGILTLISNGQRPLTFAFDKGMKHIYWASEYDLLLWVLRRNKIDIHNAFECETDYRIDFWRSKDRSVNMEVTKLDRGTKSFTPFVRAIDGKPEPPWLGNSTGSQHSNLPVIVSPPQEKEAQTTSSGTTSGEPQQTSEPNSKEASQKAVVPFLPRLNTKSKWTGTTTPTTLTLRRFRRGAAVDGGVWTDYSSVLHIQEDIEAWDELMKDILGTRSKSSEEVAVLYTKYLRTKYSTKKPIGYTKKQFCEEFPECSWCFNLLDKRDWNTSVLFLCDGGAHAICGDCAEHGLAMGADPCNPNNLYMKGDDS